jgi:hypothetical protein
MMQATENMHPMTFGQYDQHIKTIRTRVPLNGQMLLPTQLALIDDGYYYNKLVMTSSRKL